MAQGELYYFDEQTRTYKVAEKEKTLLALVKLDKQREDVEEKLEQQSAMIEARFGMFEQLLRSELQHTCDEVDAVKLENEKSNNLIKAELKQYAQVLITKQRLINETVQKKIDHHDKQIVLFDERLDALEGKDTKKKAKRWDLVAVAFGSGFLAWVVQALIGLLNNLK